MKAERIVQSGRCGRRKASAPVVKQARLRVLLSRMACPFFVPSREADPEVVRPARSPLGALFTGECQIFHGAALHDLCNFGYARGICPHFPADAEADAVRFTKFNGRG